MALKHDAQGFLAGDPIDIGRALAVWDDIRSDVRTIRQAVLGAASVRAPARRSGMEEADPAVKVPALLRPSATPKGADKGSRAAALATNSPTKTDARTSQPPKKASEAVAKPAGRDSKGRFVKKSGGDKGSGSAPSDSGAPAESTMRNFADRVVSAVSGAGSGMEEADPAVKAFQEVAQPMARGYAILTGGSGDKRKEGWFRKIYASLTGFRKDETLFNKAANKSLKNLEEKPEGGGSGGGGILSMLATIPLIGPMIVGAITALGAILSSLLSKIPFVGPLFKKSPVAGSVAGNGGSATATGTAKGVATAAGEAGESAKGGLLKRAGGFAGKFAKKIPLIGSLLALGLGAMESSDIEGDTTTTRDEKNAKQGKNWGGVSGGLGGVAAGAAIGTVIFPGVGTIIGGVVGAIAGDWLGGNAGEIIGKNFKGITDSMAGGWGEIKAVALGTWDWVKEGWDDVSSVAKDVWGGVSKNFSAAIDGISKGWEGFVNSAKSGWDSFAGLFSSAYDGLKSLPVIGAAIQAAEDAAKAAAKAAKAVAEKTAEVAVAAKDKAVEVGSKALDATKSAAGSAWDGTKNVAANLVPDGLKNKIAVRRAIETGADYKQGNIAGLDDTHTRALVASTAATESAGGKLDTVNSAGYMGRYQAGAGWLADAGQIKGGGDAVKSAMKADGFNSEYKWGQSGGMTRFLKNDKNWSGDMNYDKYLASADVQDSAFKANSDKSYQSLVKKGVITKDMSQDDIAGILKARHIGGEGGATMAAKGVDGAADANGTTALKYKNDLAAGNIYAKAFSATPATPVSPVTAAALPAALVQPQQAQTAFAAAPKMPSFASPPPIAEAPPVINPLASGSAGQKTIAALAPPPDAGQDVKDRRIAHIVTGGFSAG